MRPTASVLSTYQTRLLVRPSHPSSPLPSHETNETLSSRIFSLAKRMLPLVLLLTHPRRTRVTPSRPPGRPSFVCPVPPVSPPIVVCFIPFPTAPERLTGARQETVCPFFSSLACLLALLSHGCWLLLACPSASFNLLHSTHSPPRSSPLLSRPAASRPSRMYMCTLSVPMHAHQTPGRVAVFRSYLLVVFCAD